MDTKTNLPPKPILWLPALLSACLMIGLFLMPTDSVRAQGEANIWYFGSFAGLDFNNGPPVALTNSAMSAVEGCATISDGGGNVLFYTNGLSVWDANHTIMPNGTGLQGAASSTQSAIIVPKPGNPDIYYIFTVPTLRYSEVDMSLNGGNGDVVAASKNTFLLANTAEKVTAVGHANGTDFWVISHTLSTTAFYAYHISSTGVNTTAVVSNAGTTSNGTIGHLLASPDGSKVAISNYDPDFELFDFDNSSGMVSNARILDGANFTYGFSFSPNSQILYRSLIQGQNSTIEQYDLTQGSAAAIIASKVTVGTSPNWVGAMSIGPDFKIYGARDGTPWVSKIDQPDVLGTGCGWVDMGVSLAGFNANLGLPAFVQTFFLPLVMQITDTCYGDNTLFQYDVSLGGSVDSILWDFGEPSSGAANNSTLDSVHHIYANPGTYNIQLISYLGSLSDTLYDTITIFPTPTVMLGNDTSLCPGDTLVLSTGIGTVSYLWQDSTTSADFTVDSAGTYWVQVSNECGIAADTIHIDTVFTFDVDLPEDTVICDGNTWFADGSIPGGQYLWSTGTNLPVLPISTAGTFWVEATNICGTSSDTVDVFIEVPPVTNLPPDTTICDGQTVTLNAAFSRSTYLWSNGTLDSTLVAGTAGQYWVEVTNPCGMDADTFNLIVDFPIPLNLGPDTVVCAGSSYFLSHSTIRATNLWNDGSTGTTLLVNTPDTYWLAATNTCGTFTDTINVDYEIPPTVDLGNDRVLCDGDSVDYDVTFSRATYQWSTGAITPTNQILTENLYSVTVTNPCGVAVDTVFIGYDFPVDPDLGPNQVLCSGDEVVLDASQSNYARYFWNTSDTIPVITATSTGMYWVKLVNACGSFGDSVVLNFRQPPEIGFPADTTICGEEGLLNSFRLQPKASATSHRWQNGSAAHFQTISQEGLYWLEASNECGTNRDSIQVNYQSLPPIELGNDTFFCQHLGGLQWDIYQPLATYEWQDGSTSAIYIPEEPGVYAATIFDEFGCENKDQVRVDACPVSVWLPNSFSPNNDQINDVYKAEGEFVIEFELRIFDRWGKELFKTTNMDEGWNGTYNGVESPIGTYVYKLYYRGETTEEIVRTGSFHLIH